MPAVKKTNQFLLKQYHNLENASYGGVSRFAKKSRHQSQESQSHFRERFGLHATQTPMPQISYASCKSVYDRRAMDNGPH